MKYKYYVNVPPDSYLPGFSRQHPTGIYRGVSKWELEALDRNNNWIKAESMIDDVMNGRDDLEEVSREELREILSMNVLYLSKEQVEKLII
jgi:hypothetical protein